MSKKVMIVEDHEELQILYKAIFRKEPDFIVVAQEETAEEALIEIPRLKPDVIIIDISLPGMDGLELTTRICKAYPHIKILVVTGHDADGYLEMAKKAGADNLITKDNAFLILDEVKRIVQQ